jgi:formate-dependent nitrite reductase cytochrome c552 subunit
MNGATRTSGVLISLAVVFFGLSAAFYFDLWGHPALAPPIALVDTNFISTATARMSAADLIRTGGDVSGMDCYACHEKSKPPKLKFNAEGEVIVPKEHDDIVMGHGRHHRNNNCYNCHDENNLEELQTRDGRHLKLAESPALCGSCHGPTYRDWEAGVHGRTSGFWKRDLGAIDRKVCTSCHNPHSPPFPSRQPAPGPHPLHPLASIAAPLEKHESR